MWARFQVTAVDEQGVLTDVGAVAAQPVAVLRQEVAAARGARRTPRRRGRRARLLGPEPPGGAGSAAGGGGLGAAAADDVAAAVAGGGCGGAGLEGLIGLLAPGGEGSDVVAGWLAVDVLRAADRLASQAAAIRLAAVCALSDVVESSRYAGWGGVDTIGEEVAAALQLSVGSAGYVVDTAVLLRSSPLVWDALACGDIDPVKARILGEGLAMVTEYLPHDLDPPPVGAPPQPGETLRAALLRQAGQTRAAAAQRRAGPVSVTVAGVPVAGTAEQMLRLLTGIGIEYARSHTARSLRVFLDRLLAQLDPLHQRNCRRRGMQDRGVWALTRCDGMTELHALVAHEDAAGVLGVLDAAAAQSVDEQDDRSVDQRRADALVDLITGRIAPTLSVAGTGGAAGTAGAGNGDAAGPGARACGDRPAAPAAAAAPGSDPTVGSGAGCRCRLDGLSWQPIPLVEGRVQTVVNVVIPVESLAGLSEQAGAVTGFGAIPADVARRLAAGDARWRHVLVHRGSGAVLDVGTSSYRPTGAILRHVKLRDGHCRFPGCTVRADRCDADHLIPFPAGPTSVDNLSSLCRHHHRVKHETGWQVEPLTGHQLRWISPGGTVTITEPERLDPSRYAA